MRWIIHYDIVAFAIIGILIIVYSIYGHLKTFTNNVYKRLLYISLFSVITDISSAYAGSYFNENQIILNYSIHLLHFIVQNLVPCFYCLFAYSLVYENEKINRKWFAIIFVPYIFNFSLIISTPLTNACFYFDQFGEYHRGTGQVFTYSIAIYYIIASCAIVLKNIKVLSKAQSFSVLLYSTECILLNLIQIFFPAYLLQEIGIAFAMFFIYITLQNPLEYKDVQTDTYNRPLFKKIINSKISQKEEFSIICVQIAGLRYINEKFGINNGNLLLNQIATFLKSFNKNFGVYRLSTKQFAVVLPGKQAPEPYAEKIIDRFKKPFVFDGSVINVNLWAYLCCIKDSKDVHSLNDIMDIIEYTFAETNNTNRNRIVYASIDILNKRRRESDVINAIQNAINRRSFQVFYQPIYSLKEKKYTRMEALVRLFDESLGFVSPEEFIPLAERHGQILSIGEIVLEKVCNFIKSNNIKNLGINKVQVNLSVIQCMQENIRESLMEIILKSNIPTDIINFEITETTATNAGVNLENIMEFFSSRDIDFSLDDYGTGYSNQTNIMKYPYSLVKIDKSMVWECDTNPNAIISLKHSIAMIKDLNMSSLAEGIETLEQKNFFEKIGCEYLQGFYFSKPLPEDKIIDIIQNTRIKNEI